MISCPTTATLHCAPHLISLACGEKVAGAITHRIFQSFTASLPIWINEVGLMLAEEIN